MTAKQRKAIDSRWDIKMVGAVMDFTMSILDDINPRLKALARKEEGIYSADDIEEKLWPLLRKVRRITQAEKK